MSGVLPPTYEREAVDRWERTSRDTPAKQYSASLLALSRGDVAGARSRVTAGLAGLKAQRQSGDDAEFRALLSAVAGLVTVVAGDTTAGVAQIERALAAAGTLEDTDRTLPLRLQWTLALTGRPETRERGIERLRYGFQPDPLILPYTYFLLGRALTAQGDRDGAAQAYGQFLRLWDKADPEFQPLVRDARHALQELIAEHSSP
ncbi:MAG: hypothetical protein H0W67_06990 [Gemmatimonadales bacterium]|nr:hypothetical protein [Gemmatimonadales bacterium]